MERFENRDMSLFNLNKYCQTPIVPICHTEGHVLNILWSSVKYATEIWHFFDTRSTSNAMCSKQKWPNVLEPSLVSNNNLETPSAKLTSFL